MAARPLGVRLGCRTPLLLPQHLGPGLTAASTHAEWGAPDGAGSERLGPGALGQPPGRGALAGRPPTSKLAAAGEGKVGDGRGRKGQAGGRGGAAQGRGCRTPSPFPGLQGARPLGDARAELSVGIWAAAEGAVPSALAGAGLAVPGCGQVVPLRSPEAVGTLPAWASRAAVTLPPSPLPAHPDLHSSLCSGLHPAGPPRHPPGRWYPDSGL